MTDYVIRTERLGLRNWTENDVQPFLEMNQDPEVMRYFPKQLSEEETREFIGRMQRNFSEFGFCYFAADVLESSEFIGMIGILHQTFESEFTPSVDIGWRLKRSAWGKGYATEGAKACLTYAFQTAGIPEVFSFASLGNKASEAIMKKIGMEHVGHFQHPKIMDHEELRDCVVYMKKNDG